ncbi:hypothetical protein cyc_01113 [Cyclospora cayetanensis]|uniref:Uncharacterized protein n=1 Tax=Cyclospora cayetanensis TaxID=88456 RepID=A0A1D3CYJ7_9EIME|nr:hypothetical protein cyc_01113 [Cyclospora cayetanensis]
MSKIAVEEIFLISHVDDLLDKLHGSAVYLSIDFTGVFSKIFICPGDKRKRAFYILTLRLEHFCMLFDFLYALNHELDKRGGCCSKDAHKTPLLLQYSRYPATGSPKHQIVACHCHPSTEIEQLPPVRGKELGNGAKDRHSIYHSATLSSKPLLQLNHGYTKKLQLTQMEVEVPQEAIELMDSRTVERHGDILREFSVNWGGNANL